MKGQSHRKSHFAASEHGMALIIVIFVVALASMLVINLAWSTNLGAHQQANLQRTTEAEYLLKSAVNFARVLIYRDKTPEDSAKDPWGLFVNGAPIPAELLGMSNNTVRIELEIRPEDSKIPLTALMPAGKVTPEERWRLALLSLFQRLGFDNDKEMDRSGLTPGRSFSSEEMVANLIDYMDPDKDSYPRGIEAELPEGSFPNQPISRIAELNGIPGFPPARMRKLTPYLTATGIGGGPISKVNINVASSLVLSSLHQDLDEGMVAKILAHRSSQEGPFTENAYKSTLNSITGDNALTDALDLMLTYKSRWYQVIAKVDYGTSTYFIRCYLNKDTDGALPTINSVELF